MDSALMRMLNLLLESERAGVAALEALAREVEHEELRKFLLASRDQELENVRDLERLIEKGGGTPSSGVGPFAQKVAALGSLRERLNLMSHGQEWVARKVEETLALAPAKGPIRDYLQKMANRHRFEVEWGRAEVIKLLGGDSR